MDIKMELQAYRNNNSSNSVEYEPRRSIAIALPDLLYKTVQRTSFK